MTWLSDPNAWIGLLTLAVLEIVLGIDNIVFISILASKLPAEQQAKARQIGLGAALFTRLLMLLGISWIVQLEGTLFTVGTQKVSGRDLILLAGGLFLIYKAVKELHDKLEGEEHHQSGVGAASFGAVIAQIAVLDLVFSIDSVITAVGMVNNVQVMVAAVIIAVAFMLFFVNPVSNFVDRHPTVKVLALAFLILIGVNLIAEAFHREIPKGYTYFAMAFSVTVEMLNIRLRGSKPRIKGLPQRETETKI